MSFQELKLDPKILKAVADAGFRQPTAIQSRAVPVVLSGRDLMGCAQTGTGKTAAFVLPLLHKLLQRAIGSGSGPRALVVTPTRELALQIGDAVAQFGRFCNLATGSLVGGVSYAPQNRMLGKPLDLLVATPGRLLDHMKQGHVDFSRLETLVLDEADRMLDMGFIHPIRTIAAAIPARRQTLLFSATLEGQVLNVARDLMRNPERVQLTANHERHAGITQRVHRADDNGHKRKLLAHYLGQAAVTQALVFTATKHGARRMAKTLGTQGHAAAALHGDMSQAARKRTVEQMRRGEIRVLVATDVAARGLDIRSISHVINFDLPTVPEDYIHRIGRTGRAQASGTAVSLVIPSDRVKLNQIERLTGRSLECEIIAGLEPDAAASPVGPGHGDRIKARPAPRARSRRDGPAKAKGLKNRSSKTPRKGKNARRRAWAGGHKAAA